MSAFILKLIAVISMSLDHVGLGLLNNSEAFRILGRPAFILYAFLIANSFYHLKDKPDRINHHLIKLGTLCLISEPIYDYFITGSFMSFERQSVMITLFFGFFGLALYEEFKKHSWAMLLAGFTAVVSIPFKADYSIAGILLIYMFYVYLNKVKVDEKTGKKVIILSGILILFSLFFCWNYSEFGNFWKFLDVADQSKHLFVGVICTVPVLAFYNDKKGYNNKALHIMYSIYYPVHLLILCFLIR